MDRDFIARNQIVERYLSGRLPLKGAIEFEQFCRANPDLLGELGVPDRVNAALRLLETSGMPSPWEEKARRLWESPKLIAGLAGLVLVLGATLAMTINMNEEKAGRLAELEERAMTQPLLPAAETRTIRLLPSFTEASHTPAVIVGGDTALLADLKIDMSRSQHRTFRVTIDRIGHGRFGVLRNLQKDSNGHLNVALNTSALGPGKYQFSIDGLTWRGEVVPEAWVTIGVQR